MKERALFLVVIAITCLYVGDAIGQYRTRPPKIEVSVPFDVKLIQPKKPDIVVERKDALLPLPYSNGKEIER